MNTIAMVPVKGLETGKSRLAACLSARDRSFLIELMFLDVLATLRSATAIDDIWIVTADHRLCPDGCTLIDDTGAGLEPRLVCGGATGVPVGRNRLDRRGRFTLDRIVGHPDGARRRSIQCGSHRARSSGDRNERVGARSSARVQDALRFDSRRFHEEAAQARELPFRVLQLPGLAHDIALPKTSIC